MTPLSAELAACLRPEGEPLLLPSGSREFVPADYFRPGRLEPDEPPVADIRGGAIRLLEQSEPEIGVGWMHVRAFTANRPFPVDFIDAGHCLYFSHAWHALVREFKYSDLLLTNGWLNGLPVRAKDGTVAVLQPQLYDPKRLTQQMSAAWPGWVIGAASSSQGAMIIGGQRLVLAVPARH